MNRRDFLRGLSTGFIAGGGLVWPQLLAARNSGREMAADLIIVGGGMGGVAAALAACRSGLRVILTEETDWIGGQLTAQAVPPDEHPWIESHGCTRSYRGFRDGVRAYYRDHFPLTAAARANGRLNPGNGWVSRLCHEPRVALAVLQQMLAPHLASGRLRCLMECALTAAQTEGDRVQSVTVRQRGTGREHTQIGRAHV